MERLTLKAKVPWVFGMFSPNSIRFTTMETRKEHWEKVYATNKPSQVSWTEEVTKPSLDFLHSFNLPKTARIIDIGGGDSHLVDYLLSEGYQDITVLDISEHALERARNRLGAKAAKVKWIVSDVVEFQP